MASYPCTSKCDTIEFVVDGSKKSVAVRRALCDSANVFAYKVIMDYPRGLWEPSKWMPLFGDVLSKGDQAASETFLKQKVLPIDALLKVATPAPFGRDGETVHDPNYRRAFEIPRSRLPSDLLKVLDLGYYHAQELQRAMKPALKKWTYQLYKIHLYGPGGKFDNHVDTLHRNNHVATVVLSLPSEHSGGILRVQHHGETKEFDFSKQPKKGRYGNFKLRYGAFFTDCTHSVQEVVSGWRVVAQYDVYEEGSGNLQSDDELQGDEDDDVGEFQDDENQDNDRENDYSDEKTDLAEQVVTCLESRNKYLSTSKIHNQEQSELVQALLKYISKIPPERGVAFFLRHRYSLPALNELVLKGADRVMYDALSKQEDLSIAIQGVIVYIRTENGERVSVDATAVSMNDFLRDDNDQQSMDSSGSSVESGGKGKRKKAPIKKRTIHLLVDSNNSALQIHDSGETGNEAADGYSSYYVACMIITYNETGKPAATKQKCR